MYVYIYVRANGISGGVLFYKYILSMVVCVGKYMHLLLMWKIMLGNAYL